MEKGLQKATTGMILGKFMPPHLGHQCLVDFARNYVDNLTVLGCSIQSEPIPGDLRYRWMREMFPDVNVVHVTDENPQEPKRLYIIINGDWEQRWQKACMAVDELLKTADF
jgi:HTH-type transcriptional regulator, transcriptional repressor of NAD biosynthesis genes